MGHFRLKKFLGVIFLLFILVFAQQANAKALTIKQGEVLLYQVNYEKNISAYFGGEKIPIFYLADKNYILIAADLNKKLGNYNLRIKEGDKEVEKKLIQVKQGSYKQKRLKVAYKFSTLPAAKQAEVKREKAPLLVLLNQAAVISAIPSEIFQPVFKNPLDDIFITSPFGYKRIYTNYSTTHRGVDIKAEIGTPVYAIGDGEVLWGEDKELYLEGPMIAINHGSGVVSEYLHLSKIVAKSGTMVHAGDIIAYSGDQGADVTGPHLHFALKVGKVFVNPIQFIEEFKKLENGF